MIVSKYNANGNDFVIFHTFGDSDRSELALRLCDRYRGVGADGLIVLKPGANPRQIVWEFYNCDGSVAKMCGNGSRAAAQYAVDNGLCGAEFGLVTLSGVVGAKVGENGVETELTSPKILSKNSISKHGREWRLYDTGVPHIVSKCENLDDFDAEQMRELRHKYDANANLYAIKNGALYVRTFERGVEAETLACGTGMAACFYDSVLNHGLKTRSKSIQKVAMSLGLG